MIEDGVVALLGVQDAADLLGIDRDVLRLQPGAVQHGRESGRSCADGGHHSCRRSAAAWLLRFSLFFSAVAVAIILVPLQEQSADGGLFVYRLNGPADQPGDRQLLDLRLSLAPPPSAGWCWSPPLRPTPISKSSRSPAPKAPACVAQAYTCARPRIEQRLAGLHQRSGSIDNVVEDETGAVASHHR